MKPDVIVIGAGIGKTALAVAAEIAAMKNTAVVVVSPAEAKQNPFQSEPIPFVAAPRYEDPIILTKERKNYITGKNIPKKKRRK